MADAKLIMVGLPADRPRAAARFYNGVVGGDFARSFSQDHAFHAPVSADGVDFLISKRHSAAELPMPYFAVDDVNVAIDAARHGGGTVVWGPADIPIAQTVLNDYKDLHREEAGQGIVTDSVGSGAIIKDPQGNLFGVVELAEHTHEHFKVGRFRQHDDKRDRIQQRDKQIGARLDHGE